MGEKSSPPTIGSALRMGARTGSVTLYTILASGCRLSIRTQDMTTATRTTSEYRSMSATASRILLPAYRRLATKVSWGQLANPGPWPDRSLRISAEPLNAPSVTGAEDVQKQRFQLGEGTRAQLFPARILHGQRRLPVDRADGRETLEPSRRARPHAGPLRRHHIGHGVRHRHDRRGGARPAGGEGRERPDRASERRARPLTKSLSCQGLFIAAHARSLGLTRDVQALHTTGAARESLERDHQSCLCVTCKPHADVVR